MVKDITLEELVTMIKSDSEDEVNLYVTRNKENLELKFVRGNVELTSVTSKTIEKNGQIIGLIDISIFAKNSYEQFKRAYEELEKDGITSLIVDVRNNNGGYLATAKSISELFLQKKDIIFIIEDHNGKTNQTSSQNGIIKVPVVLLIDGSTASASEVLAAALQENLDIELIGTTTYGKGSVQKTKQLSSGATIKYTTEKWLTPSGKSIDGHGIEPTIKVEQSKKYFENPIDENDEQLQKAIEILTNNK